MRLYEVCMVLLSLTKRGYSTGEWICDKERTLWQCCEQRKIWQELFKMNASFYRGKNSIFYVNSKSFSGCSFEGMLASCPMTLGGHHVQASARINHCHSPIDVQFLVMANNDRNPTAHNTDTVSWLEKEYCVKNSLCLGKFREIDLIYYCK